MRGAASVRVIGASACPAVGAAPGSGRDLLIGAGAGPDGVADMAELPLPSPVRTGSGSSGRRPGPGTTESRAEQAALSARLVGLPRDCASLARHADALTADSLTRQPCRRRPKTK